MLTLTVKKREKKRIIYFIITKSIFIKQTSWSSSKHATWFKKRASRWQINLCSFFISYYTSTIFAWLIYFRACINVLNSPHKNFYFTCLSDMMIEISCFRFYLIDFIIRNWKFVLFLFVLGFFFGFWLFFFSSQIDRDDILYL